MSRISTVVCLLLFCIPRAAPAQEATKVPALVAEGEIDALKTELSARVEANRTRSCLRPVLRKAPAPGNADDDIVAIVDKMIKQRRESIAQFERAGRNDLADNEKFEIGVLSGYLPQQLSEAEVAQEVAAAISQTGAAGVKDMGKVMGVLKPRLAGKADMGKVSNLVKTKLSG